MPTRKRHSKEHTARISAVVERTQALISDDPRQSLHVLMDVVKPWMETVASGRPYIFQQDSAPTHTSYLIQNWLSDNVNMFGPKNSGLPTAQIY